MPYQPTDVGLGMHTRKIEEVDASAIDRIFSSSRRLSDEAIVDFVRHLCEVSRQEMDGGGAAGAVCVCVGVCVCVCMCVCV